MICPDCHTENAEGANYCAHCGADLSPMVDGKKKWLTPDTFLLAFIGVMIVGNMVLLIMRLIGNALDWSRTVPFIVLTSLISICLSFCYILVPLAIKKPLFRIIGLIATGIFIIYLVISTVISMFTMLHYAY